RDANVDVGINVEIVLIRKSALIPGVSHPDLDGSRTDGPRNGGIRLEEIGVEALGAGIDVVEQARVHRNAGGNFTGPAAKQIEFLIAQTPQIIAHGGGPGAGIPSARVAYGDTRLHRRIAKRLRHPAETVISR